MLNIADTMEIKNKDFYESEYYFALVEFCDKMKVLHAQIEEDTNRCVKQGFMLLSAILMFLVMFILIQ